MEVLHDGIWEKLPVLLEDYGFSDICYELEPGEYRFIDIDFAWLYGELHEGWCKFSYRMQKGELRTLINP